LYRQGDHIFYIQLLTEKLVFPMYHHPEHAENGVSVHKQLDAQRLWGRFDIELGSSDAPSPTTSISTFGRTPAIGLSSLAFTFLNHGVAVKQGHLLLE
jgi:hypothetical protein